MSTALVLAQCACGGGGGGDSGSSNSQPSAPAVASVSQTLIPAGTTFIVTGTNLNLVASWLMGASSLTVVSSSSTLVTLQAPNAATSGSLGFVDMSRNSFTTPFTLQTYVPISVSQLSPNVQVIGQPVTLNGAGLDAITAISLQNARSSDAAATITTQTSSSLTFIVPLYAQSGSLTLTSPYERVTTAQTLSITPRIWFDWLTQQFSGADLNIILQGANLDQVSSATVGGVAATLSSQSTSSLTLTVPRATRGAIVLSSGNQPSRNAGAIDTLTGGSTTFFGMSFGQVLEEEADNPQLRLTPGKPAGVRAFIASSVAGVPSPVVTLTATNGAATLGTLTLSGPSTLPTTVPQYDASQTFNAVLPGAWVSPGLTVQISYTPGGATSPLSLTEQPPVGNGTTLNLVVVPTSIGSFTASVPSTPFAIRGLLAQALPYPFPNINVTTRAAFVVSGLTAVRSSSDIASVLSQLETIRTQEAPNSMYYGLINDSALEATASGRRIAGVGWINDPDNPSSTWRLSAVGTDSRANPGSQDSVGTIWAQWQRTMVHELGHVHSRYHAPCGGAAGPDPNFPYANGLIGPQPIYASFYTSDTVFGSVGSPSTGTGSAMADIMSYCPGAWFSDYNYYYVQRFAEKSSGASAGALAPLSGVSAVRETSAFLVLSGEIAPSGVRLRPALLSASVVGDANSPSSGYQIIVKTVDGQEFTRNLSPIFNSEDPDTVHFSVSIPAVSRVASVQLRKFGVTLPSEAASSSANPANPTWQQDPQGLAIKWDAGVEPYLSVFRVTRDGRRQVLALFATGGELRLPASDIAGAGVEIQLSSTLNARKLQIIAP